MTRTKACIVLIIIAAAAGLSLRLPCLDLRTMHTDEAVHAEKFRLLLEDGKYEYDRHEYHGPTLNYLTLLPAKFISAEKLTDITESTLRIVPVFFGLLLILLLLFCADALDPVTALCAAAFTAVSPAMVYYSRYYIQEMLLVCFTFGIIVSAYRYSKNKTFTFALLAGLFVGLAYATKETFIITAFSALAAMFMDAIAEHPHYEGLKRPLAFAKPKHLAAGALVAIVVSVLFFSSFFKNPAGVTDCIFAYKDYIVRAGSNPLHIHPWHYYLQMLLYSRYGTGPIWSEAAIVILSLVGFVVAFRKKPALKVDFAFFRFIAFYTVLMTIVYSIIPYKTPWCLLSFFHGMILLAALGASAIITLTRNIVAKTVVIGLLVACFAHLAFQAFLGNYKYHEDPVNPYVYAHTLSDVRDITDRIAQLLETYPVGNAMFIEVACKDGDYWPLPWYLRSFTRFVGYYDTPDETIPPGHIIITSPEFKQDIIHKIHKLYEAQLPGHKQLYVPMFQDRKFLRPMVELLVYVRNDICQNYQRNQADSEQDKALEK